MTKYKLEEFKLWLEIRNIPKEPWNWEKHLSEYEDKPEEFARLLEEAPTGKGKTSDNKTIHYYNDLVNSVIRWKREVDNKAKEAKKKKKQVTNMGNALTTLKGQLTEKTTNLKHWKEFFEALDVDGNSNWIETAPLLLERFWTWKEEWGDLEEYWETFYQQLTEKKEDKNNEFKNAFLPFIKKKKEFDNLKSKIKDLENSLLALAKQKLKGKKEAKQLLTQLESNWKAKEQTWTKSEQDYLKNIQELKEELATSLQLHQTKIKDLETQLTSLSRQKITTQQQLTQTQTHYELRKKQATIVGIISLVLILYLAWPLTNKEKEAPRTWTYV